MYFINFPIVLLDFFCYFQNYPIPPGAAGLPRPEASPSPSPAPEDNENAVSELPEIEKAEESPSRESEEEPTASALEAAEEAPLAEESADMEAESELQTEKEVLGLVLGLSTIDI